MSLNPIKQANKKWRHEQRRKKHRKLVKSEDERIAHGDYRPVADRYRRRLKDSRNHHRKKQL